MQTVQGSKQNSSLVQFGRPVFVSQIKKLRKRICWEEPTPLYVSSYTHLLCKVQDPFHACRQSKGLNKFLLLYNLEDQSLFQRSKNSGRELVGWNQLLCKSVLTPISCAKFKIHSTHADSLRA